MSPVQAKLKGLSRAVILDINRITLTSVVVTKIIIIICILFIFCRNRRSASWQKGVLLVSACAR